MGFSLGKLFFEVCWKSAATRVASDGNNLRRVTNHPERDDYAAWHPDGKHLVMVSERQGHHDLRSKRSDQAIHRHGERGSD